MDAYGYYGLESHVWQDPFITDTSRAETAYSQIGGGVKLNRIMGKSLDLEYKFRQNNVEQDFIGQRLPDLNRNGATHNLAIKHGFKIGNNMVVPMVAYSSGKYEGEANSFDTISGGAAFVKISPNYALTFGYRF